MDNVTHALAGLALAELTTAGRRYRGDAPSASFRRTAAVVGVVAAELPDADLLYAGRALGMGQLGYLLHHRGHTHTVVVAVLLAFVVWGATLAVRRGLRGAPDMNALLALSLLGTLVGHLTLDWTNSYGVHPFWPVNDRWYYGDAVFIVEPWLWVLSIPPLVLLARSVGLRLLLGVLLLLVLGAAWAVGMVQRDVALAYAVGAVAWTAVAWLTAARHRAVLLGAAWLLAESTFAAASRSARAELRAVVGGTMRDAALTPAIGDPTCFTALVVERDGATYRVSSAVVAPWPSLRVAERCAPPNVGQGFEPPTRRATPAVQWGGEWSAPRAELAALASDNCEVGAVLRFVRVPVWARSGGTVRLWDARFGRGGFAGIDASDAPRACPRHVPPWIPPRADMLR